MASNSGHHIPGSPDAFVPPVDVSHYQLLGISHGATRDEIAKAYREKARKYHPDKTGTDLSEEWMKRLNDAKAVLLSEKRQDYDEKLADEGQAIVDPSGYLPQGNYSRVYL